MKTLFERMSDAAAKGAAGVPEEITLKPAENCQKQVAGQAEGNHPLASENGLLRADLRKLVDGDDFFGWCEGCGAPLLLSDDYVSDDDCISGCWNMMVEAPPPGKPCFAYRVGKPSAEHAPTPPGEQP